MLVAAFEADYPGTAEEPPLFAAVAIGPALLEEADALTAAHVRRAYDAVQLASALIAREADPTCRQFDCFDEQLRAAAPSSGYAPVPLKTSSAAPFPRPRRSRRRLFRAAAYRTTSVCAIVVGCTRQTSL